MRIPKPHAAGFAILLLMGGCTFGASIWPRLQAGEREKLPPIVLAASPETTGSNTADLATLDPELDSMLSTSTLRPPTRQTSLEAARHACRLAHRSNRALLERLQPPEKIHVWEDTDARYRAED